MSSVSQAEDMGSPVTLSHVKSAYERISRLVKNTPVLTSHQADEKASRKLHFKSEHMQITGSFKARGALNAVLQLKAERGSDFTGVVTHSSGNHGQALAWASQMAGIPCTVVVPENTPICKKEAIRKYGAKLVECYPSPTGRIEAMKKVANETGQVYVSSCDDPMVIAGQGSIGLELLEQVPDLDAILVTISGGGMASGIATAVKALKPSCKVFLVTPKGKMMEECLRTGERLWPNPPQFLDTIAEGIRLQQAGMITFEILKRLVEKDVFEMSDDEMIEGMKFCFEDMKQVVESAAGAAVAAAFSDKMKQLPESIRNVGVILCGGNTDLNDLPWCQKPAELQN